MNKTKTEAVKFRKGGKLAASGELKLGRDVVRYVNSFTYLGITLTVRGFLERVLGVHHSSRNRLVYHLVGTPTLVQEARATLRSVSLEMAFRRYRLVRGL